MITSADMVMWFLCNNKQVHDAGHMVPMDQPEASLEMLKRWMEGKLVEGQDESEEPEKLVAQM